MSLSTALIGGVGGAIIGFFTGGSTGALQGLQVGTFVGGLIDANKSPAIIGPRLSDLTVQTSTYGAVIPRAYGTVALCGNVFWLENNRLKEVATTNKSGGKGGGGGSEYKTFAYYATFAVGLCKGPISGVRRIWIGKKLVYNVSTVSYDAMAASNQMSSLFTLHTGSSTQLPDSRMQATLGAANTPAYRGLAYLVFKDLPLRDYGNSLAGAQIKVEVQSSSTEPIQHIITDCPNMPNEVYVASTGKNIVAGGTGGAGRIYVSKDGGLSVREVIVSGLSPRNVNGLYYIDGKFCLYAIQTPAESYKLRVFTSIDGFSWINQGLIPSYIPSRFTIAKHNSTYVMTSMWSRDCWLSVNGIAWNQLLNAIPNSSQWLGLASSGKTLITISYNTSNFAISKDGGNSWYIQRTPFGTPDGWTMAYIRGAFYAFTIGGDMSKSYDEGVTWTTPVQTNITSPFIAYSENIIFITGGVNYAYSLDDGQTWTSENTSGISGHCCWNGAWFNVSYENKLANVILKTNVNNTATLAGIISTECLNSKFLVSGDIDVTLLSQQVRGYMVSSVAAIRAALSPLQGAFQFDIIQSGYKIKFKPRGNSSVVTVPAKDLGAEGIT